MFEKTTFNAILGLIALAGIIMRNSLILIGQIQISQDEGLDPFHAVVEATVQRVRPVILTALAAVFAFIPLTLSVFWSSMAYTLIGGTIGGTILTLAFLPPLYAMRFKIKNTPRESPLQTAAAPSAPALWRPDGRSRCLSDSYPWTNIFDRPSNSRPGPSRRLFSRRSHATCAKR